MEYRFLGDIERSKFFKLCGENKCTYDYFVIVERKGPLCLVFQNSISASSHSIQRTSLFLLNLDEFCAKNTLFPFGAVKCHIH